MKTYAMALDLIDDENIISEYEEYHDNELNDEPTNTVVYPSPRSANDIRASLIRRGTLIHELKLSQILKQSNDLTITSEDEESDGSTRHSDSISFNEKANAKYQ